MVTETKPTGSTAQRDEDPFIEECLDKCWRIFIAETVPADPSEAEKFLKDHFRPFFTNQMRGDPDGVWGDEGEFVRRGTRRMAHLSLDRARLNGRERPNHDDLEWAANEISLVACVATDGASEPSERDDVEIRGGWCTQGPEST